MSGARLTLSGMTMLSRYAVPVSGDIIPAPSKVNNAFCQSHHRQQLALTRRNAQASCVFRRWALVTGCGSTIPAPLSYTFKARAKRGACSAGDVA